MSLKCKMAAAAVAVVGASVSTGAFAQEATELNFCSGGETGNYYMAASKIAELTGGKLKLNVVETAGSMENLAALKDGSCDVAVAQEDAIMLARKQGNTVAQPLANLFTEYVQMVCNPESGVEDVTDLIGTNKILALGEINSGPWATWEFIVGADERYKSVQTTNDAGREAFALVEAGEIDCVLNVAALNSITMAQRDAVYGTTTDLVEFTDKDLFKIEGARRGKLYSEVEISDETYPNWLDGRSWSANDMPTTGVQAKLVVDSTLSSKVTDAILAAQEKARAAINAHVAPK